MNNLTRIERARADGWRLGPWRRTLFGSPVRYWHRIDRPRWWPARRAAWIDLDRWVEVVDHRGVEADFFRRWNGADAKASRWFGEAPE